MSIYLYTYIYKYISTCSQLNLHFSGFFNFGRNRRHRSRRQLARTVCRRRAE